MSDARRPRGLEAAARREARAHGAQVLRPVSADGSRQAAVTYVRTRPRGNGPGVPVVLVPGGPGLASVAPYRRLRALAARRGLDVLMVEHRGVGLSQRGTRGQTCRPPA